MPFVKIAYSQFNLIIEKTNRLNINLKKYHPCILPSVLGSVSISSFIFKKLTNCNKMCQNICITIQWNLQYTYYSLHRIFEIDSDI